MSGAPGPILAAQIQAMGPFNRPSCLLACRREAALATSMARKNVTRLFYGHAYVTARLLHVEGGGGGVNAQRSLQHPAAVAGSDEQLCT